MATWHQQKAGLVEVYRPDKVKFKLVENPPNDLCTVGTYDSREAAEAYIDRRVNVYKNGKREHFSIIPPCDCSRFAQLTKTGPQQCIRCGRAKVDKQ